MSRVSGEVGNSREATALVVEDNEQVRGLEVLTLRVAGLNVIGVADASQALAILRRRASEIDLLVTDVVMPNIGGAELARAAVKLQPGIRVLFASGYGDEVLAGDALPDCAHAFLEKPFGTDTLVNLAKALLTGDRPDSGQSVCENSTNRPF